MFKIQDSLTWISKALGIDRASALGEALHAPDTVLDTIQAVVDAKGWQAIDAAQQVAINDIQAGPTTTNFGAIPPDDEWWYVFACTAFHDQPATTHRLDLGYNLITQPFGGVIASFDCATSVPVILPRPILVIPQTQLFVASDGTVTTNLILRYIYNRIKVGEHIPGAAPYG